MIVNERPTIQVLRSQLELLIIMLFYQQFNFYFTVINKFYNLYFVCYLLYFLIFILIAEYFRYFDDLLIFSRIEFLHTILLYKNSTITSYFEFYLMIILFICSFYTLIILLEIKLAFYCFYS